MINLLVEELVATDASSWDQRLLSLLERILSPEEEERFAQAEKWRKELNAIRPGRLKGRSEWDTIQTNIQAYKSKIINVKIAMRKATDFADMTQAKALLAELELGLEAALERAQEIKDYYRFYNVQSVVFDPRTSFWKVNLSDKFWHAVKMGQIEYIPGMAAELFYKVSLKSWESRIRRYTKAVRTSKHPDLLRFAKQILSNLRKSRPMPTDEEFIRQGANEEEQRTKEIAASLVNSKYYAVLDEMAESYRSIRREIGRIPVAPSVLIHSAMERADKGEWPKIAWAWAKHSGKKLSDKAKYDATRSTPQAKTLIANEFERLTKEGRRHLIKILKSNDKWWTRWQHPLHGLVLDIRIGSTFKELGIGARFSADGSKFIGLLDEFALRKRFEMNAPAALVRKFGISDTAAKGIFNYWRLYRGK